MAVSVTLGTNSITGNAVNAGVTVAALGLDASYDLRAVTITAPTSHLDTASVKTVDSSNQVLAQIDAALQQLAATGAQLGSYQNRFQADIAGIHTTSTNLQAARSQIQDTDYAAATGELSKAQILQQASTAMVSQANTVPQNVLTLLQHLPG